MIRKFKKRRAFSLRDFTFLLVACLTISALLSFYLSKNLSNEVTKKVLARELEIAISAMEAGPVAFARLQSSTIVDDSLRRLFANGNLEARGFISVTITGGPKGTYTFGKWQAPHEVSASCLLETDRDYSYAGSINPIRVRILQNSCVQLDEEKLIQHQSTLETGASIAMTLLFLFLAIWPAANSLRLAEKYIKNGFDGDANLIRFASVRDLILLGRKSLDIQKISILGELSRQLAHDIRSPLSALNMVVASVENMPDEKRTLIKSAIKRINDIANELLTKSKEPSNLGLKFSPVQVAPLLETILREKKAEFAERPEVKIELKTSKSHDVCAKINTTEFSRVISNLINNSVSAIMSQGIITIEMSSSSKTIQISIKDTGKGISPSILKKLGDPGFTYGKSDGSGLGILHAMTTLENLGGTFEISSVVGEGTMTLLKLPRES